jgi:protein required for attachment to host cells
MNQTWILVGDGSHARFFEAADATSPWQLLRRVDREHSREKTDRAESHEDRGEHEFARQLIGELETARESGSFKQLVLVAPPKFLGQLRSELATPLEACVVKSLDKDYTQMAEGDLPKHVQLS